MKEDRSSSSINYGDAWSMHEWSLLDEFVLHLNIAEFEAAEREREKHAMIIDQYGKIRKLSDIINTYHHTLPCFPSSDLFEDSS